MKISLERACSVYRNKLFLGKIVSIPFCPSHYCFLSNNCLDVSVCDKEVEIKELLERVPDKNFLFYLMKELEK